ncbi:hypothetical protein EJ06DRAFT_216564 [Trichodelitschia bisporula]|uniref:Uncharacterized protein n=1 Tax=Trichodelitschia bisporula TaxID=703511 RepID=A0A6G1I9G8_9PEZI|nr:hypothetical protein EJ06DRAFT_216564 [Trichodelitschia bisporula]
MDERHLYMAELTESFSRLQLGQDLKPMLTRERAKELYYMFIFQQFPERRRYGRDNDGPLVDMWTEWALSMRSQPEAQDLWRYITGEAPKLLDLNYANHWLLDRALKTWLQRQFSLVDLAEIYEYEAQVQNEALFQTGLRPEKESAPHLWKMMELWATRKIAKTALSAQGVGIPVVLGWKIHGWPLGSTAGSCAAFQAEAYLGNLLMQICDFPLQVTVQLMDGGSLIVGK